MSTAEPIGHRLHPTGTNHRPPACQKAPRAVHRQSPAELASPTAVRHKTKPFDHHRDLPLYHLRRNAARGSTRGNRNDPFDPILRWPPSPTTAAHVKEHGRHSILYVRGIEQHIEPALTSSIYPLRNRLRQRGKDDIDDPPHHHATGAHGRWKLGVHDTSIRRAHADGSDKPGVGRRISTKNGAKGYVDTRASEIQRHVDRTSDLRVGAGEVHCNRVP